jgi:uncharacterized protein (TIGR03437 family)
MLILSLAKAVFSTLRRSAFAQSLCLATALSAGFLVWTLGPLASSLASPKWLSAQIEEVGEELRESGKRQAWFYQQRAYPLEQIPTGAREEALVEWEAAEREQAALRSGGKLARVAQQELAWQALGPRPIAQGQTFGLRNPVSGRVTAIVLDPRYNGSTNQTVYVGGAQGGLWRSTDNGANWTPITDALPSLAIGAVAIDPANPNIIYVGTGEPNRSGDSYFGAGLFKTTDGGLTWTQITGPVSTSEPKLPVFLNCTFSRIAIDPAKPNTLFVATNTGFFLSAATTPGPAPLGNRGLWKSTDGGLNWLNVNPSVSKLDRLASDVVLDPRNSNVVYAALTGEGVYRSTANGELFSWKLLTKGLPEKTDNKGNPVYDRIVLALGPPIGSATASTVYAAYAGVDDNLLGIFRSTDMGETWTQMTTPQRPGQASYNLALAVDPTNGNNVFYGTSANSAYDGGTLWRSLDAGRSWEDISFYRGTNNTTNSIGLHPDTHVVVVSPANPNILFTGNDGGIWRTNAALGAVNWTNLNATLNITQFQSVAVHPYDPNLVIGGTQDNGTNLFYGNPAWAHVDDGDGGAALIDQSNPQTMYHTYFNVQNFGDGAVIGPAVSFDGGVSWLPRGCFGCATAVKGNLNPNDRVAFYAPMALNTGYSGANGNVIYFGTYRLYRSQDQGKTWLGLGTGPDEFGDDLTRGKGVISTIAVFPSRGGVDATGEVVWTGSSDGMVYVTQNGHELNKTRFFNVTRAPLPNRFVTDIAVDPRNVQRALVTFSGFNRATPNTPGHVFYTNNFGGNWIDISGNLPDVPVNAAVFDPNNTSVFYIGTDIGVFQTNDAGRNWVRLGNNFPQVSVLQLRYQFSSGSLVAATHGRGVYRLTLNPRTLATVSAASFSGGDLAADGVASAFGTGLAVKTEAATVVPLPTTLAGTRVYVRDSFGTERAAPLFFVSAGQINFQIPSGTTPGNAVVTVINNAGQPAVGNINVNFVKPSLFTANANGSGVPAGIVFRMRADGSTATESLFQPQGNQFVPVPIDVSNPNEQVYLVLFGTGFRYRSSIAAASVTFTPMVNGAPTPVSGIVAFAGAQGSLIGVDQTNLRVPATLAGRGEVNLVFNVDGQTANPLRVIFK